MSRRPRKGGSKAGRRSTRTTAGDAHIAEIHEAERVVDEVESARERFRGIARGALGVTGAEEAPDLRESITRSGVGWYPLLALCILLVVDQFQGYGFFVLGPEIARAIGIDRTGLAFLGAMRIIAIFLATVPMAAYVHKHLRRGTVAIVTAILWSVMTLFTGLVTSFWGLFGVLVADGASTGSVVAVHPPLLMDTYPPEVRVRANSFYRGALAVGTVAAPLLVALFTVLGFTWRGVFIMMGVVSLGATLFALRLRDPGFGRWDTGRVREAVRRDAGQAEAIMAADEVRLGTFEIIRRLLLIPTVRRLLAANAVLGMMVIPLYTFIFFFLEERWGMRPGARGLVLAVVSAMSVPALVWFGRRGEARFRADPAGLIKLSAGAIVVGVAGVALTVLSPDLVLMVVFFGIGVAAFQILFPALNVAMLSIVVPSVRAHAAALAGIFYSAVGGFGGLILLGGMDRRFGTTIAILSLSIPGFLAALVLRGATRTINPDLDRLIDELVEEEELRVLRDQGTHLPMLACRNIDFAYGQLQVLFDVSFTVDDGEIVALLGTNGAGKSTLLRVISGMGLPMRGSVRLGGADITYLDAERRLRLGIAQIPGGRSVYGPLTVLENLRLYAYSFRRDRRAVEGGIEASFEAFPVLAERRNQPAVTLSGGEQQMLGLAKALILKPRLLLIDELTLGLAPRIVSELLEMVRRINQAGTAVVLVEQSVNVALSLVDHAYFMEKGEIRFDGRAEDLLDRTDLLRSVFLEGAAKGLRRGGS